MSRSWPSRCTPSTPSIRASLPGLRIVCVREDADGSLSLVPLNLDTLHVDMEAEQAVLLWRAMIPVASPDVQEIKQLGLLVAGTHATARHGRRLSAIAGPSDRRTRRRVRAAGRNRGRSLERIRPRRYRPPPMRRPPRTTPARTGRLRRRDRSLQDEPRHHDSRRPAAARRRRRSTKSTCRRTSEKRSWRPSPRPKRQDEEFAAEQEALKWTREKSTRGGRCRRDVSRRRPQRSRPE